MVIGALMAIGQEIVLACGENPTKVTGSKKLLPRLRQFYNRWRKEDPPTTKQIPVEADDPELLANKGRDWSATELESAIGDLSLITFYYLLCIREYKVKSMRNKTKQTVQFKYEDITFFKKNSSGLLRCLPRDVPNHLIDTADGATMKLENQKNGWKGVCIYQEANSLVGKSVRNSAEFHNKSNFGPFELRNFHRNFIFPIVKCVPANSQHVSSSSESYPAINSSNFMNQKTFPLFLSVVSGIKFRDTTHQLFLCAPLPTHCSQYLPNTHKFMKPY
jgi:hypothetical protein